MKVTENIKEILVHYVKTHDEQKTARLISWILVGAMSIAFLGILSCAVIRPKADNNVTRNTGAGGTTIQREYPNPADYGYNPATTLIDENGKAYVWVGDDEYARPDTYNNYINDPIWRRHFVNEHPTGYKTIFKWDCPTCLENITSEQNIISNTDTELDYKGINMAFKKKYSDTRLTYGNTVKDPPLIDFDCAGAWNSSGSLIVSPANNVGFLQGGTQEEAVVQACINYGYVMGWRLVYIGVVPTTVNNDSSRLVIAYKDKDTDKGLECGTDSTGLYIKSTNGSCTIRTCYVTDNQFAPSASTFSLGTTKKYFATTTTNNVSVENTRLIYYNPDPDATIRKMTGTNIANTPSAYTEVYNPLNEAQLVGTKYVKYSTTAYPNLGPNTNQTTYAYWMMARMVGNYGVITGGGASETEAQEYIAQGRQEVINSPNTYNLYTAEQYTAMRTTGRNDVINSPHTYNLYTAAEYTAHGQAEYQRGYANAAGTPSSQDWKISTVVKAVPEGMYTFYQNIVEPIQDPTEELLGVNVGALVAVVAVIGLVVIGIAIVKKVF